MAIKRKFIQRVSQTARADSVTGASVVSSSVGNMTLAAKAVESIAAGARSSLVDARDASVAPRDAQARPFVRAPENHEVGIAKTFEGSFVSQKPSTKSDSQVPEISSVRVGFGRGTVDTFNVHVSFVSRPVTRFDLFRMTRSVPRRSRRGQYLMSLRGLSQISAKNTGEKNSGKTQLTDILDEKNFKNAVSRVSKLDIVSNDRTNVFSSDAFKGTEDKSVSEDLLSIRIADLATDKSGRLSREVFVGANDPTIVSRLGRAHIDYAREQGASVDDSVAIGVNRFSLVSSFDGTAQRDEYEFVDETVELGSSYSYYVVAVDDRGAVRSKIQSIDVEHAIAPFSPSCRISVASSRVSISATSDDELVEKFEIFKKGGLPPASVTVVNDESGHLANSAPTSIGKNGYYLVGEVYKDFSGGGAFIDRAVVPGNAYLYRVYSVDIFGNKSQDPTELRVFVADDEKKNDIAAPSISVEPNSGGNGMKITVTVFDPRVTSCMISRRDLTLKEKWFTTPRQPEHTLLGAPRSQKSRVSLQGRALHDSSVAWDGVLWVSTGSNVFLDDGAMQDHTYQYMAYGVSDKGEETTREISKIAFYTRTKAADTPISLVTTPRGDDGKFAIDVSWKPAAFDINPEEAIGSKEKLDDSSIRILYQLERRETDSPVWEQFPLMTASSIVDSTEERPAFYPRPIELGKEYVYRVLAYQSGGFVSNYSAPVRTAAEIPVQPPTNVLLRSCDSKHRPLYVVVNWDDGGGGAEDKWIVERAAVNNFAAPRVDVRALKFVGVATVPRESSRSRASSIDRDTGDSKTLLSRAFVGTRHYLDRDVQMGNTYYYRIRAQGNRDMNVSQWVVKGIRMSDSTFEKKLNATLTQKERDELSTSDDAIIRTKNG